MKSTRRSCETLTLARPRLSAHIGQLAAMAIAATKQIARRSRLDGKRRSANAVPAFILQGAMLALLVAYYVSPGCARHALNRLAHYKRAAWPRFRRHRRDPGRSDCAGAVCHRLFPERKTARAKLAQSRLHHSDVGDRRNSRRSDVSRECAAWFGDVVTFPVVIAKICVDQFGYNPFFAAPAEVLVYEWKNEGISWKSVRRALTWEHYRDKIVPTLLATWAVWMPLMAIIYSLPLGLAVSAFQSSRSLFGCCS